MPDFRLVLGALCDDVRAELRGKYSLMGLFDRFMVGNYEEPLPKFSLFAKVACREAGEHGVVVTLASLDDDFAVPMEGAINAGGWSESEQGFIANLSLTFRRITIPHPGRYVLRLVVGDEEIGSVGFAAAQPVAADAAQAEASPGSPRPTPP